MIYPNFVKPDGTLGVTAPSAGVGNKAESFDFAVAKLKSRGYRVVETPNVRNAGIVSADAEVRAREFCNLIADDTVDYILMASGGDFMMEVLPYINFELISQKPKWIQGYSDATNILYPVTTLLEIATAYGLNAGSFDRRKPHRYIETSLDFIGGNIGRQFSFDKCSTVETRDLDFSAPVFWEAPNGDFTATGRLLGGCLDCLCDTIAGTGYDGTLEFIRKYHDDGTIWYFDVFSMSAETVARGLWRLGTMGWFDNASAFVFGRIMFPSSDSGMSYKQAIVRELGTSSKIVINADVGHLPPTMTLVNGAMGRLTVKNGAGEIDTVFS